MRILKFLHKPAKAVDQSIEAGETQQPSQRHLGRSDDRFTDPRLKLLDDGMRKLRQAAISPSDCGSQAPSVRLGSDCFRPTRGPLEAVLAPHATAGISLMFVFELHLA